jgi:hypothetical protein
LPGKQPGRLRLRDSGAAQSHKIPSIHVSSQYGISLGCLFGAPDSSAKRLPRHVRYN